MGAALFFDVFAAVAVTALLAEGYGIVRRKLSGSAWAPYLLGVVFGLIAMVQMQHPLEPFDGLILDLRNIPIALAGAFLGWRGLLPCLALAMVTRYTHGGVGMESGLLAMTIAGVAGMVWARSRINLGEGGVVSLLLLGVFMSTHLFAVIVLPRDVAIWFLTTAALPMLGLNMVTVPLMAALLQRENIRIRRENHLVASVTHDAASGLLLGPAFLREVSNSYAARAFGTYAGFLTLTPERGTWQKITGLFGDPATAPMDRQTMCQHLTHGNLAGLCVDGRVLVPLTPEEINQINRVKTNLTHGLRTGNLAESGTTVSITMCETPHPEDFLRIAETALIAESAPWSGGTQNRPSSIPQSGNDRFIRRAIVLEREEHDVLFAKADFLFQRKRRRTSP